MQYDWPGNIRELMNTIEQALAQAGNETILYPRHLPKAILSHLAQRALGETPSTVPDQPAVPIDPNDIPDLRTFRTRHLARIEKQYLTELMSATGGCIKQACTVSGLSRARLYTLLKRYNVSRA
jgi:two-component system NtrC family response regulator